MAADPRQLQIIDQPQTYIAQVAITPEQALKAYQDLRTVTAQVLKKGTDYDVIPGTPKPSLLKSGAENLLRFCGLGHRVEKVSSMEDWENGFFYFEYKVIVHKSFPDGTTHVLSECIGSANSREPKYYKKRDGSLRNPYEQVNTLQKMAIKRALVGATLQATGASGLFTQDIEDMDLDHPQQPSQTSYSQGQSQGKGNANKPQNTPKDPDAPSSDQQRKAIYGISKGKGLEDEQLKSVLLYSAKKESSKDLTMQEASDLIKLLQSMEKDELLALVGSKITGPDEWLPGEDKT